jgi:hypothetical protein
MKYTREDAIKAAMTLVRKVKDEKFDMGKLKYHFDEMDAALQYFLTWRTTSYGEADANKVFASASALISEAGGLYQRVEHIPETIREELNRLCRVMSFANLMVYRVK